MDSVVPIYCSQGMDVQDAINRAVDSFKASKDRFDQAADSLLSDAQKKPLKFKHVAEFIEGCQYYCLGNLAWRYVTFRSWGSPLTYLTNAVSSQGGMQLWMVFKQLRMEASVSRCRIVFFVVYPTFHASYISFQWSTKTRSASRTTLCDGHVT